MKANHLLMVLSAVFYGKKVVETNNTDLTAEFHEILSDLCGSDAAYNFQPSDLDLIYQAMSKVYEMSKTDK